MRIESFTIKNYRSIRKLKIENLNPVNVFFGKNNVGKSNILRGLHLAFHSLKNNEIFLPDTIFYRRNSFVPIEITTDLILEEDFCDTEVRKGNVFILLTFAVSFQLNSDADSCTKPLTGFPPIFVVQCNFLSVLKIFPQRDIDPGNALSNCGWIPDPLFSFPIPLDLA